MSHHSSHQWNISRTPWVWPPSYPTTESVDGSTANGICNFRYNVLSQYKLSQMCTVESGVLFLFGLTFFLNIGWTLRCLTWIFPPLAFIWRTSRAWSCGRTPYISLSFSDIQGICFTFGIWLGRKKKGEYFRREAICHLPSGLPQGCGVIFN